jgi:hypothetical protein
LFGSVNPAWAPTDVTNTGTGAACASVATMTIPATITIVRRIVVSYQFGRYFKSPLLISASGSRRLRHLAPPGTERVAGL